MRLRADRLPRGRGASAFVAIALMLVARKVFAPVRRERWGNGASEATASPCSVVRKGTMAYTRVMPKFPHGTRCVYCATTPWNTVDHVPPKCLFAKDNRNDLIRVPSCRDCNGSFSKDDEYFLHMLSIHKKVIDSPDTQEGRERMFRALKRDDHRRMLSAMVKGFKFQENWMGGIYRGLIPTYRVDNYRISTTVSRTIKGLFWYENKEVLSPDYVAITWPYTEFTQMHMDTVHTIYAHCFANGIHRVGETVFEYTYTSAEDAPYWTCWITKFYQSISFVSLTVPKDIMRSEHANVAF